MKPSNHELSKQSHRGFKPAEHTRKWAKRYREMSKTYREICASRNVPATMPWENTGLHMGNAGKTLYLTLQIHTLNGVIESLEEVAPCPQAQSWHGIGSFRVAQSKRAAFNATYFPSAAYCREHTQDDTPDWKTMYHHYKSLGFSEYVSQDDSLHFVWTQKSMDGIKQQTKKASAKRKLAAEEEEQRADVIRMRATVAEVRASTAEVWAAAAEMRATTTEVLAAAAELRASTAEALAAAAPTMSISFVLN